MEIARLRVFVLGTFALGGVACGSVPAEQNVGDTSSAVTNPTYAIRTGVAGGLCFDSQVTTGELALRDCKFTGNASQQWYFPASGNLAGFFVENSSSSNCISVFSDPHVGNPVRVELLGTGSIFNEEVWKIAWGSPSDRPNFSSFQLQNAYDGLCLTARQSGSVWQADEEQCAASGATYDAQLLGLDTF